LIVDVLVQSQTGQSTGSRGRRPGRVREEVRALAEIVALCGLAIAAPLLDITGRSPDFFLFRGARFPDILLLVAFVVAVPPLLLWGLGAAARPAGARWRRGAHVLTVGALCAALAVQAGKALLPLRGLPLALLAVAAGAACVLAYARWSVAGRLLRVAAVGPLVFALLFVAVSPTGALVRAGLASTGLASTGGSAGAGRAVGPHPPLVVLLFDEFPQLTLLDDAGRIDAARFPAFASLAGDATWYRNATAVRGFTPYALPSMLTGRYPTRKAAPHYTQYPDNLFTLLAGTYDLRVRESVVNLCPPPSCAGPDAPGGALPGLLGASTGLLGRVLSPVDGTTDPTDDYVEPTGARSAGAKAGPRRPDDGVATFRWDRMRDSQPARFREFVADLRRPAAAGRPTLYFVHLLLPHKPFRYLPSGLRYPAPTGLPRSGAWWARLTRERHVLQARYADRLLGEALAELRASGLYDRAAVVVTADHGIAFPAGRGYLRNLTSQEGAAQVGWVPMFVKAPGQRTPRADHRNVLGVDLLPTLASYAGLTVPWRVDGVSAVGPPRAGVEKPFTWDRGRTIMLDPGNAALVLAGPDDALGLPGPPRPDLLGARVDRLPVAGTAAFRATVPGLDAFARVDPATGLVPAFVKGTVPAAVPAGTPLALALNGVVVAVVPVLPLDGVRPRFAAMLGDGSRFRPGANDLALFLVEAGSLRRLPVS
jgi:hypothetical protein